MNKLITFITVVVFVLILPVSNAADKAEIEKLYSMQIPGTIIQCKKKEESVFTTISTIAQYTVTGKSEHKTKMEVRAVFYVTGFKELRIEAEFKTTRTMLDTRDMWESDPDSLVINVSGQDALLFNDKNGESFFKDYMKFNYDEHSEMRFTTYPDYVFGENKSGLFSSEGAVECTTHFPGSLPPDKAGMKAKTSG